MALDVGHELTCLSTELVRTGVAPHVALGFAVRSPSGRWEVSAAGATSADAQAFFDLASLTKPMTAFAIASSDLDRNLPTGAILEEARGTPTERLPIELLLAHRSGLAANAPLFRPLLEGKTVDRSSALREAALARRADASGPVPAEGYAPLYSDLGYVLAGEALARTSDAIDAGEVVEASVVASLGLDDELGTARALGRRGVAFASRVVPTEHVDWRGGLVRGQVHDENAWALTGLGGSGHAGMFGTVSAVLSFGVAALDAIGGVGPLAGGDRGWLVRPRPGGTLRAGFDGKSAEGSTAGTLLGARAFGHLGFTGTSLWVDPDAGVVVALLTNRVCPTRENVEIRAARPRVHDALFALATRKAGR